MRAGACAPGNRQLQPAIIAIVAAMLAGSPGASFAADLYVREELRIPDAAAGPRGLEALLVRPGEAGRYPLALINHGSPRSPSDRPNMTPWSLLPEAIEFARRGFAAAVVMRRGYGGSDGNWAEAFNGCADSNYLAAGEAAAADLKTATAYLRQRPDIDGKRVIAVGVSAGGFATVALTANPPPGLAAAISFAGGRGSWRDNEVCRPDRLLDAFTAFGKRSRVPMLWVYAENDHFFGPKLAEQFKDAFVAAGGNVEFIAAPAFGDDGHRLFSAAGIPIWSSYVDAFLKQHGLMLRAQLLPPPPLPALAVPAVLGPNGRAAFDSYLKSPPHKAFAVSPAGYFGWQSGVRTTAAAKASALQHCEENGRNCSVVFVDDAPAANN